MIDDFQTDLTIKSRMYRWGSYMDTQPKTAKGTFPFYSRRQTWIIP